MECAFPLRLLQSLNILDGVHVRRALGFDHCWHTISADILKLQPFHVFRKEMGSGRVEQANVDVLERDVGNGSQTITRDITEAFRRAADILDRHVTDDDAGVLSRRFQDFRCSVLRGLNSILCNSGSNIYWSNARDGQCLVLVSFARP